MSKNTTTKKSSTKTASTPPPTISPEEIDDHFFPSDEIPKTQDTQSKPGKVEEVPPISSTSDTLHGISVDTPIRFYKTSETATLPTKNHNDDIGWDVYANEDVEIIQKQSKVVSIGLGLADINPAIWLEIKMRSGLGFKHDLDVHHGIIDTGYRGEMGVKIRNLGNAPYHIRKGDKIAQLIPRLQINTSVEWADKPTQTKRGSKGFGSSGK